jgi:UDP-glucose 4-epimerase
MTATTEGVRPKRVLVLGKHGFIASHLIRHLEASGFTVEGVGKDAVDLVHPDSVAALERRLDTTDVVVIASALTPDKGRDVRTLTKNLAMAEHLCQVFDRRPCAHVVYLSSDAVYDARRLPVNEDSSREPADLYALMHTSREMMLGSVLAARQVPFCILRPVAVYGHGDTHDSYGPNRFLRQAFEGGKISLFGEGEERRCHLYIEDAVRLIARSIEARTVGALNLAPPEAVTFREVAETIRTACPFAVELELKPRSAPGTDRPYAIDKLRHAFPESRFISLPEGIERTVRRLQQAGRR